MNWEVIGATGEWAGAIAVVLTLLYLARQIRQQNDIAKYQAWQNLFDGFNQSILQSQGDKQLNETTLRGLLKPEDLDDAESMQLQSGLRVYFNNRLKAHRAYQHGFLEESDGLELAQTFHAYLDSPGGKRFQEGQTKIFKEFWKAIEKARSKGDASVDFFMGRRDSGT